MITAIQQFIDIWESETASTLVCFGHLTDDSLTKELLFEYRTIDRITNHIVDCAASIPKAAGLELIHEKEQYPSVASLISGYTKASDKVKEAVLLLNDEDLQEEIPMYGETWKKGFALWVTVAHQAHHRGQLTVLMRMAGLKVPGIYGPAKEEWEEMNFPKAD